MKIAVVNLLMRTVKSRRLFPQLDPEMPRSRVRAESPMAVLVADELSVLGHDVDIFVGAMFDVVRDSDADHGRRARIVYTRESLKWAFPPSYYPIAPSLLRRMREGRYEAVITTDLLQPSTLETILAVPRGTRIFVWQEMASHPRFPAGAYSKAVFSFMRERRFRGIEKFIPRSDSAGRFLVSERVPRDMIAPVIPNAVDCKLFSPDQPQDFFQAHMRRELPRPRTIMVSRIDSSKGIGTFLEAAKKATDKGYRGCFVLKVVGSGVSEIEAMARQLGLEGRLDVIGGYLPRKDLANLMGSCDMCAAPSSGDLLFFVPIEAMASGMPVITTTQTHHASTFADESAGLLVAANDPDALADGMLRLSRDPARLKEMGRRARQIALREFSLESVALRFENMLDGRKPI